MAKKYEIKAIKTGYNGVVYRSQLEARYAVFFDLAGWEYQYEPFRLTGWIPDFLIQMNPDSKQILAEVKPKKDYFQMVKYMSTIDFNRYRLALLTAVPQNFSRIYFNRLESMDFSHTFADEKYNELWHTAGIETQYLKKIITPNDRYNHP
jgi:hypothetical protein